MTENTTQHSDGVDKSIQGLYAEIHGLKMYYEIHGAGFPLVLLHGGLSAIGTLFGKLLPGLADGRQVIAIEQQAHGHTADIDRPLTYRQVAEDTITLLSHIGVEQADFFGYSIGAGIAMEIAIEHPARIRKLVAATPIARASGFQPDFYTQITKGVEKRDERLRAGFVPAANRPTRFSNQADRHGAEPDILPCERQSARR